MEKTNIQTIVETKTMVNELSFEIKKSNAFSEEKEKILGLTGKLAFLLGSAYGKIIRYEEIMKDAGIEF